MAAFETARPAGVLTAGALNAAFADLLKSVANWNDVRKTRNALRQLNLRELDDIGLTPADINSAAIGISR